MEKIREACRRTADLKELKIPKTDCNQEGGRKELQRQDLPISLNPTLSGAADIIISARSLFARRFQDGVKYLARRHRCQGFADRHQIPRLKLQFKSTFRLVNNTTKMATQLPGGGPPPNATYVSLHSDTYTPFPKSRH